MISKLVALVASVAMAVGARSDENLARIRNLAKKMLQAKNMGAESAYCEYVTVSQVDGCSGPGRNAVRHRISRTGVIESWDYRTPGQSGDPIGYYRGRINDKQWRTLVQMIASMRWTENPMGLPRAPLPPGPTESVEELTLSDGKIIAGYGKRTPTPPSISDAIDQPGVLARGPMDTIWQLSLVNPKAEIRKDSLHFTAEWKWRGSAGARLLFSQNAGGEFCGTARFKWFLDTSDFSVEWHEEMVRSEKGRDLTWSFPGTKPSTIQLVFPYDGPKGKAKRVGMMDGIGIRLIPPGSMDTISATIFTDRFEF